MRVKSITAAVRAACHQIGADWKNRQRMAVLIETLKGDARG